MNMNVLMTIKLYPSKLYLSLLLPHDVVSGSDSKIFGLYLSLPGEDTDVLSPCIALLGVTMVVHWMLFYK